MKHDYKKYIESVANFPKAGVMFWDFTPILQSNKIFCDAISDILLNFKKNSFNQIAAIEAKGFVVGGAIALKARKPLVLIRKPGLIPGKTISALFEKEYGFGEYQIKKTALKKGDKVLLIYDIMAGAGATLAAINLIEKTGAKVAGCAYIIELEYLGGREQLDKYKIFSLVKIKNKLLK
jgi:adenine phosphoribosyltransferase